MAWDKQLADNGIVVTTFPEYFPKHLAIRIVKLALASDTSFDRIRYRRGFLAINFVRNLRGMSGCKTALGTHRGGRASLAFSDLSKPIQLNGAIFCLIEAYKLPSKGYGQDIRDKWFILNNISRMAHELSHALDQIEHRKTLYWNRSHDCRPHEARANSIAELSVKSVVTHPVLHREFLRIVESYARFRRTARPSRLSNEEVS